MQRRAALEPLECAVARNYLNEAKRLNVLNNLNAQFYELLNFG
jgi:hypothetical protein